MKVGDLFDSPKIRCGMTLRHPSPYPTTTGILCQVAAGTVALICTRKDDANRWHEPVKVENPYDLKPAELEAILNPDWRDWGVDNSTLRYLVAPSQKIGCGSWVRHPDGQLYLLTRLCNRRITAANSIGCYADACDVSDSSNLKPSELLLILGPRWKQCEIVPAPLKK